MITYLLQLKVTGCGTWTIRTAVTIFRRLTTYFGYGAHVTYLTSVWK